jgi:carbon monoxide dehydrogenase subunit G
MIFEGEEAFAHGVDDVWLALHDMNLLTRTVPGCKSMTLMGPNEYKVALSLGVAAVKGEYEGKAKVIDVKPPSHYVIKGEGAGAPGFVKISVDCYLQPQGAGTVLKWRCEATVGGMIASIGGKALSGISKFMAKQFFTAFKKEMAKMYLPVAELASGPSPLGSVAAERRTGASKKGRPSWFIRFWNSLWLRLSRQQRHRVAPTND